VSRFDSSGFPPGEEGITPEFLLNVSDGLLRDHGSPILPVGQGASQDSDAWAGFVDHAFALGMGAVSVWRYGVTGDDVWRLLKDVLPVPRLAKGVGATVANTGSCLNVRERPTIRAPVRACLPDGAVVTVRDGPAEGDGYRWWLIEAEAARGWSAEGEPGGVPWLVPLP
jgi:hypothetical protein